MGSGEKTDDTNYVVLRTERRSALRKHLLVLKVRGEDCKGTFFGYAKNISAGGMFIASVNPRKHGEEFDISFRIEGETGDVRCRCVVAWHREYNPRIKQEPGMGIKFIDLPEETRERIEAFVRKGRTS